ncbi:hypothetical protein PMAYCL1PPCAC_08518, partial [Pristionchus mayeri]
TMKVAVLFLLFALLAHSEAGPIAKPTGTIDSANDGNQQANVLGVENIRHKRGMDCHWDSEKGQVVCRF